MFKSVDLPLPEGPSPKDSRKDTAKSPKCVMIQLLRLIKHKGFDGDELYLFEH